jgi:Arm DNA-binding domain
MLGTPMLTDAQIRKAKAADKPYKLTDGAGLHVYVTPAGGKQWRLRYEFERTEKLLSIGPYPRSGSPKREKPSPTLKLSGSCERGRTPPSRSGSGACKSLRTAGPRSRPSPANGTASTALGRTTRV